MYANRQTRMVTLLDTHQIESDLLSALLIRINRATIAQLDNDRW